MFSGIVEAMGEVVRIESHKEILAVFIEGPREWKLDEGESISVDGVCSTVLKNEGQEFQVEYMPETLRRTTLGNLKEGRPVNLERSLHLNSLLSGHLVQGHVDCTGRIESIKQDGGAKVYGFQPEENFDRYLVPRGSVSIDGISLTVVETRPGWFSTSLIPYTLDNTTLRTKSADDKVNLEFDVMAKYAEKLLEGSLEKG